MSRAVSSGSRAPWIGGSSVEGQYKLARAYMATGQADRARAALDDAVRAYSGAPRFKRREERLWRIRAAWLRWTERP